VRVNGLAAAEPAGVDGDDQDVVEEVLYVSSPFLKLSR